MAIDLGGPKPKFAVRALLDENGTIRHIFTARGDKPSPWRETWRNRGRMKSALAEWFRSLSNEPREIVILGSIGLHYKIASAIVRMLRTWFPAAIQEERHGVSKPCGMIDAEGKLRVFPSRTAAAKELKISRKTVTRQLIIGLLTDWKP